MKNYTKFILLFFLAIILIGIINFKASIITLIISIISLLLFIISKKLNNSTLLFFILFFTFTNVFGVPHAIINSESFEYSGWKAVKNFDFSYSYFAKIYVIAFCYVFLLVFIIFCLNKLKYFQVSRIDLASLNFHLQLRKKVNQSFAHSLTIVFILILIVLVSIIGFQYQIGLSGIAPYKLPFKMVGILHFVRGLIAPIIIILIASKIKLSFSIRFFILISALLIGVFSGSRGTTLFYLFPLIIHNIDKINFKTIIFKLFLLILGFLIATASQAIYTLTPGLNYYQQLVSIFEIGLDPYDSMQGSFMQLINQIIGIAHRFYGFQDYVLAYQYQGSMNIRSFILFIFSGNPEHLVKDITNLLYGLEFPEGSSFGVAMGLIGISIASFNSNFLVSILLIFYIAILIVFSNKLLISFKSVPKLRNFFTIIYTISSLIFSLILISGRLDFFYLVLFSIIILKYIFTINFYQLIKL
jgi:hypothetical protein